MLLHDGWRRNDLEGLVEALCYPLWDAGLSVGHAVRTPAEALADTGTGIDAATALLDRRLVAGDPGLSDALAARVRRWSARRGTSLLRRLAEADVQRHRRDGEHPGMLEPNLKNGAGGLRDLHSLRWAAGWLLGECALDPLVAAGYLGADDRRRLGAANDTLLEVRCALHQLSSVRGKLVDVLRLDQQDEVAALLRSDGRHAGDADDLLRRVGLATRLIAHLHTRTWDWLESDLAGGPRRRRRRGREAAAGGFAGGVRLAGGVVEVAPDVAVTADPAVGLRAAALAASTGAHLSRPAAAELFRQLQATAPLPWPDAARHALLTLLHAGEGAAAGLAEADHIGLLPAHLPEWERVRGRPQRNPLHRFDLDTHGAQAVVALHTLRRDPALAAIWDRLADPDVLLLATWLHDIGKAWPGDHSVAGAEVATRWLQRMGFGRDVTRRVVLLIRHHLLLPDVATRRDLDDPAVLASVAHHVQDAPTLDALYLLSLADARATGPSAWSPWKDDLLATLHHGVAENLRGTGAVAEPQEFPQAAVHAQLVATGVLPGVDIRPGRVSGTTVVSVVAADRPGLLADCAGALAAAEVAVVEARAVTTPEGVAMDWFTVTGAGDVEAIAALVLAACNQTMDVAQHLARPRWSPRPRPWAPDRGATVTFRNKTTVEVEALDRHGLLFDLARVLDEAGLTITAIRASTLGPTVFDVFEVRETGLSGELDEIRNRLLSAAQGTF